ncbi:Methylamine utilization protein MauG [Candidatus Zixiibacteriota bacterium]|nr:Methylamine utilization protein MauG [candidate division Zixibacteria bacterium]
MYLRFFLLLVLVIFIPALVVASDNTAPAPPVTAINFHQLGPERLGNQPAVIAPLDNPQTSAKILLGKKLYFDTRLSKDNTISCASCHDPAMGWSDAGPTSTGIDNQKGGRRAPPVANSAYNPLQFWDGRAPSLEEQAKGPVENPIEMGNTHDVMVRSLNDIPGYVEEFKAVFGSSPITVDQVARAIAAYERTIVTTDSPFDRYVRGDNSALTPLEKKGLEIFNGKGHCTACHWGSNFSDGRFHNLGVKPAAGQKPDEGRYAITKNPKDMGAFKTPIVRDAAARPPYMHNGTEKTLEDVMVLYNRGGGDDDDNLDPLMVPLGLSKKEVEALTAFVKRAMTSLNPSVANEQPIPKSELPE